MNFLFQIDSNTPGLDTLLSSLDKANVSMLKGHAGLKGIDEGSRKAGEGAKTLGGAFEKLVTNGLDPFLKRAESIAEFEFIRAGAEKLLEFPGELAEKIKDLGEEAVMEAAKAERMGLAFENALGKVQGNEALEYFDDLADKTEFTHEQMRGMGLELSKFGFKGQDAKNAAAAIADIGSVTGEGLVGAEAALSALERVKTSGRIETKGLVHFGIDKEDFLKELGGESGLGAAAGKAMEAGKVPIETVLSSLYTTIAAKNDEVLGAGGARMAETLEARLKRLKERPLLLFEGMKDTEGYKEVSDFIGNLGHALDPKSALGQILTGSINTAIGELGNTLKGIDLNHVVTEVGDVIKNLPDNIHKAGDFIRNDLKPAAQALWDVFKGVLATINDTVAVFHTAKTVIHDYTPAGAFTDFVGKGQDVGKRMEAEGVMPSQQKGEFLSKYIPGYSLLEDRLFNPEYLKQRFFGGSKDAGANDVKGYAQGVQASTGVATGAIASMADATTDALKDAHQQKSPSRLFAGIGEMDAEGYAMGIEGSADRISDAIDSTFSQPSAAPAVTGSAGPMTVVIERIEVNIEGSGGDPYEQGRLAARGMEDELELSLTRVLEAVAKRRGN